MTRPSWRRQLAGQCLILVVVLLPVLVAGLGIADPPAPGEWERFAAAHGGPHPGAASLIADGFTRVTAPQLADLPPAGSPAADALLARLRLGQLLGLAGIAFLAYFVISLAGGRARALLALVWLAVLPPVASAGHVLRPETPATLFGLLALLLLQCVPDVQRPSVRVRAGTTLTIALCLTAAVATGCAVAALPGAAGILLLLPGGAATVAAAQLVLQLLRALRRRSVLVWPMRAAAVRLWPWVLAAITSLFVTVVLLRAAVRSPENLQPTLGTAALLPEAALLRYPLFVLAALGAVRLMLRTGQRLGRRSRLGPDLLLLVYCAVLLAQRLLRPADEDALPAAVPLALLLADGVVYAVLLLSAQRTRTDA